MQSSNLRYLIATLMLLISCASFYVFITKHVALQAALPCETVTQNGVLSQNLDGTLLLKIDKRNRLLLGRAVEGSDEYKPEYNLAYEKLFPYPEGTPISVQLCSHKVVRVFAKGEIVFELYKEDLEATKGVSPTVLIFAAAIALVFSLLLLA